MADHRFIVTPTGETGLNSGRPRYRVVCTTCRLILHENSTAIEVWCTEHLRGELTAERPGYGRPLLEGEDP